MLNLEFEDYDEEYELKIMHYRQKYSWDCGLACIMMVLPEKDRKYFDTNFNSFCDEEGFGKSTWTIDLCYLLKKFSKDFIFYTTVIGVNPEHKSHFFYEKILPKDRERVTQRFKDAKKNGIKICVKSIRTLELITHIKYYGPIILLTNAGYLTCDRCKRNNISSKIIQCLPQATNYHGHYIVLCGYNLKKQQLYYRNPAYLDRVCSMDFTAINKARLCFGTDEDCIFVYQ